MSTRHPVLTDALLKEALTRRSAGGHTSAALVGDVMAAIEAAPQRRGWAVSVPQQRLLAVVLMALLLLSTLVTLALVGGRLTTPAAEGVIAFVHRTYDRTGQGVQSDAAILTVPSVGGQQTRLSGVPGLVPPLRNPKLIGPAVEWSPDGTRIAFRLFQDVPGIYLVSRYGSGLRRLVELAGDVRPGCPYPSALDWSPDGTRIAYAYPYQGPPEFGPGYSRSYFEGRSRLYVVDVANGSVTDLGGGDPSRWVDRTVDWSPDGSKIAFVRTDYTKPDPTRTSDLFVMNADGTAERRVIEGFAGHADAVDWSPDGSRLALIRRGNLPALRRTLQVVSADGTGYRDLAELSPWGCRHAPEDSPLAWSPDGRLIAMVDGRSDLPDGGDARDVIIVVSADGSGLRELVDASYFDWSPDGSRLVVSDAGGPRLGDRDAELDSYSIYIIDADGTGRRWLAEGEYPAWSP